MRKFTKTLIVALALFVIQVTVLGQQTTGSLSGTITDQNGAVVAGATVTLVSQTRGTRSVPVVTNATGDFVFPNLPADTYTIEVEMSGFKVLKQSGITVNPGPQVSIGALTLEIGGATETVSVKGESPIIQTASGERSFAIPTQTVENLPFASRSVPTTICSEVLEHLPPDIFDAARTELARVSNEHVIVTVPNREKRSRADVPCQSCAHRYALRGRFQPRFQS